MSNSDSDIDMEDVKQRQLYKLVKNKLKEILLYINSTEYQLLSSTLTNKKIIEHLTTYNLLRKYYNQKYGIPNKTKRKKFNRLVFNIIAELYSNDDAINDNVEFIKFISIFN